MHTSYTLTHIYGHRRTSTRTIIHKSKHIYAKAHKNMSTPTHVPAHMLSCSHIRACAHTHTHTHTHTHIHTHTHTCTHAQALTNTWARALTHTRAYKTKMHSQTLHTAHIHTQIHSYTNTRPWTCVSIQNLLTYTRAYTGALTFMCARAHP